MAQQPLTGAYKVSTASRDQTTTWVYSRPPWISQYPLKPEAEKGIEAPVNGLLQAGVLTPTTPCGNTLILPVLKADKSKYLLVHDLRAINEVTEDSDAEVPNPHTLLTNAGPTSRYNTVIDLCSAFFFQSKITLIICLPLHTGGQHFRCTRLPQGGLRYHLKENLAELELGNLYAGTMP